MKPVRIIIQPERFLAERYDDKLFCNAEIIRLDYFAVVTWIVKRSLSRVMSAENHSARKIIAETYMMRHYLATQK